MSSELWTLNRTDEPHSKCIIGCVIWCIFLAISSPSHHSVNIVVMVKDQTHTYICCLFSVVLFTRFSLGSIGMFLILCIPGIVPFTHITHMLSRGLHMDTVFEHIYYLLWCSLRTTPMRYSHTPPDYGMAGNCSSL